jgi:hypothetical protein
MQVLKSHSNGLIEVFWQLKTLTPKRLNTPRMANSLTLMGQSMTTLNATQDQSTSISKLENIQTLLNPRKKTRQRSQTALNETTLLKKIKQQQWRIHREEESESLGPAASPLKSSINVIRKRPRVLRRQSELRQLLLCLQEIVMHIRRNYPRIRNFKSQPTLWESHKAKHVPK